MDFFKLKLVRLRRFPALGAGYMFSRAWRWLHYFPRLALVAYFPALGAGCCLVLCIVLYVSSDWPDMIGLVYAAIRVNYLQVILDVWETIVLLFNQSRTHFMISHANKTVGLKVQLVKVTLLE